MNPRKYPRKTHFKTQRPPPLTSTSAYVIYGWSLEEIDEGITDSPDGSLRDAATATDFDPSDSSVPRYVKYKKTKEKYRENVKMQK